jgi:hypothetical protein
MLIKCNLIKPIIYSLLSLIIDENLENKTYFYQMLKTKITVFHEIKILHEELPFGILNSELVKKIYEINQIRKILSKSEGTLNVPFLISSDL